MRLQATGQRSFTLAELLVAVAIFAVVLLLLTSVIGAVNRAWTSGEQQVGTFQDGRAIVDLIGRELSQAVISPRLQFVTNAAVTDGSGSSVTRANSDNIFWQAPLSYRAAGASAATTDLCEIGYYIDPAYNLKRFFVPPTDATNYQIYAAPPSDTMAPWISPYAASPSITSTVAANVLALWIRCFDANGELIPWLSSAPSAGGSPFHYNSAAHFQPAIIGTTGSFKYTASNTAQAHALPNAVEVTLVTLDERTRNRNPAIPSMPKDPTDSNSPSVNNPADVRAALSYFNQKLVTNKVSSARTFTTRVALSNAIR